MTPCVSFLVQLSLRSGTLAELRFLPAYSAVLMRLSKALISASIAAKGRTKDHMVCQKSDQRTLVYVLLVRREEMAARVVDHVSESLLGHSLHAVLPRLTGSVPAAGVSGSTEAAVGKPSKRNSASSAVSIPSPAVPSAADVAVDNLLLALEALAAAVRQDNSQDA